jgi:hypothetical protein
MRKTVIDGSNTSGFQRTVLIARNGYLDSSFGKVGIQTICLEEDAARKIEGNDKQIVFSQEPKSPVCVADTPPATNPPPANNNVNSNLVFNAANNFRCNVQHPHNFSNNLNFASNSNRRAIHSSHLSINSNSISPHSNRYSPAFRTGNALLNFNSNTNQQNSWSNMNSLKNASLINANIRKTPVFF